MVTPPKYRALVAFILGWLSVLAWALTSASTALVCGEWPLTELDAFCCLLIPTRSSDGRKPGWHVSPELRRRGLADMDDLLFIDLDCDCNCLLPTNSAPPRRNGDVCQQLSGISR